MAEDELGERCEELVRCVLGPLVLGGAVRPVRPFGGPLALRIGVGRGIVDADLASRIEVARVRRARQLSPVDALPEVDAASFAMAAGLNDLIQVSNHHLGGPLTRGRHARVLDNVRWLCDRIPAPRDVLGALARHATFARVLELGRTDSKVSWWTGSSSFRGEPPPARLLSWREIRKVQVDARRVPLAEMPVGVAGASKEAFSEVLGLWLTRSPLSDLATAARKSPRFAWSAATLSLVAEGAGRLLAFRALVGEPEEAVTTALSRAAQEVPAAYEEARRLAMGFAAQMAQGFKEMAAPAGG